MNRRLFPLLLACALGLTATAPRAQSPPAALDERSPAAEALPAPLLRPAPRLTPPLSRERPGSDLPASAPPAARALRADAPAGISAPHRDEERPVFIRAERIEGVAERYAEAEGSVELRTRTETVRAEWLRYDFLADVIWGKEGVVLRSGIDWVTGPELFYKRDTQTGYFREAEFYFGENGGRASAAMLRFVGPERYEVSDARYTTCAATREDWYIQLDLLEIDQSRKVGTGRHATLHFLGAPIAYSPWVEFPLSGERKSGFLTPVFGSSALRGIEVATPYYLNLAPNYDATIQPRYMSKRGLQLAGQFRYLQPAWSGELDGAYLDDRETGTGRYAMSWKHNQNVPQVPGLAGYWNLNKVSDDTYFSDLSASVGLTSQTSLPREGGLAWVRGPYSLLGRVQSFQTLQVPGSPPAVEPYNRLPQVLLNINDAEWRGLDLGLAAEYARFRQSTRVQGERVYAYPTVTLARNGPWWFLKAKGGVISRYYRLDQAREGSKTPSVTLPVASLDGGLYLERQDSFFGQEFVQTLEPRAYYAVIPYKDQSGLPNFDSALDDYNFPQLFTENRYLGYDRIGDANQLTLALSSRFLNVATGVEHLRVALGQRYYFSSQQVTLQNEIPRSASSSDLLVGAEGRLSDAWSVAGLMQYNLDQWNTERLNVGARYTPAPGRVLNGTYSYTRNLVDPAGGSATLKQFDVSAQWPVAGNWSLVGRWNYSIIDSKTLEAVAGAEYNADCWTFRLVGHRLTTTAQTTTSAVYAQIELNGLARFGTNPLELLRRSVPGYQKRNETADSVLERGGDFTDF